MKATFTACSAVLATIASLCAAQTPPDTIPAVNATLGVTYNETVVTPGLLFPPSSEPYSRIRYSFPTRSPSALSLVVCARLHLPCAAHRIHILADALLTISGIAVAYQPNLTYTGSGNASTPSSGNATYMALLIDLSIPASLIDVSDTSVLVPGAGPNRTTRLHWWAGNLTTDDTTTTTTINGTLVPSSPPVAPYNGPRPPMGDIAHYYTFYLFNQGNYTVPPEVAAGNYSGFSDGRMNFNVTPIVDQLGQPIAANFILSQNNATMIMNITLP